ncbi:hypothetical protein AHN50_14920 [Salmonella enterica subsp. enterica]|nr:hypothetical protein [Salmonella enterica subsp. enterica]EDV6679008.1 hypothetical protein [Salmonella enterica subsp. enterica serovar Newmexico]EFV4956198.1 DUF5339 domain-containing protein [Salmonella enterica]EBP9584113.1 hypothetical protein [Salmonella enterica subsp. enterica]EEJ6244806.1 hypothetical protein [Salmonella enterica subsp. enterica]
MKKVFLLATLFAMSNSSFATMAESCQQYFNDIDALVEQAAATSEQAKQQFDAMKPQLEASKKQLETVAASDQDAACKQALASMVQIKQALGLK